MNNALTALEARVCADLARTAHPGAGWLAPRQAPDGGPALDVLVVGAGQSGLATAFGLMRGLFSADIERHWASFQAHDAPQAVVER